MHTSSDSNDGATRIATGRLRGAYVGVSELAYVVGCNGSSDISTGTLGVHASTRAIKQRCDGATAACSGGR